MGYGPYVSQELIMIIHPTKHMKTLFIFLEYIEWDMDFISHHRSDNNVASVAFIFHSINYPY